jgi:hypothetical protein
MTVNNPKRFRAIIIVVAAVILAAGVFAAVNFYPRPMGTPPILQIVDFKNVTVNAGKYQVYNFTAHSNECDLQGHFNATGAIQLYVMTSTSFDNWAKEQSVTAIYTSEKAANASFDKVSLPSSGTYYIIYDNTNGSEALNVDSYVYLIDYSYT